MGIVETKRVRSFIPDVKLVGKTLRSVQDANTKIVLSICLLEGWKS